MLFAVVFISPFPFFSFGLVFLFLALILNIKKITFTQSNLEIKKNSLMMGLLCVKPTITNINYNDIKDVGLILIENVRVNKQQTYKVVLIIKDGSQINIASYLPFYKGGEMVSFVKKEINNKFN
jgi:hypothetical protein